MTDALFLIGNNTTGSGLEAIRICSQMGLNAVLVTTDPSRHEPDRVAGGAVHLITEWSLRAVQEVYTELSRKRQARIVGVTTFSDPRVALTAEVAAALGLPGMSPAAAAACCNKVAQRQLLDASGVPTPRWRVLSAYSNGDFPFPAVVKPISGSGSVGVRLVRSGDELMSVVRKLWAGTLTGRAERIVLLEEYIAGEQYSAELIFGKVVGLTRNHIGAPPSFIEIGHDFPAQVATDMERALAQTAEAAVRSVGVDWGFSHVEMRLSADGPRVIEVNPRLAGGMIPELVRVCTGVDLIAWALQAAIGRREFPPLHPARAGALRNLVAPQAGRLASVVCPDAIGATLHLVRQKGDLVGGFGDFRDRVACMIATADRGPAAVDIAERMRASCRVALLDENEETL